MTVRSGSVLAMAFVLLVATATRAHAEWVFAASLGASATHEGWLLVEQPRHATRVRFAEVRYRSRSWHPPFYYGYRAGFFPREGWFGVEGEFIHLKVFADTARVTDASGVFRGEPVAGVLPLAAVLDVFSISHGVNLVLRNAVVRRAAATSATRPRPRWLLSGRVGAGASIPHAESAVGPDRAEQYEWGAFSVQGAASVELHVTGVLYAFGEYKLTRSVQDVAVVAGSARAPLLTHHVVFGLAAHLR